MVTLTIDGRDVTVPAGTTILDACAGLSIAVPTLCYLETLTPVNACRLCVVEIDGARVLAPSCARAAENGMVVHTRSPRVCTRDGWCSSSWRLRSISRRRRAWRR
jgi:NADH dehydrogenase/NADH:ubiquinone oxidoreductase subunit G